MGKSFPRSQDLSFSDEFGYFVGPFAGDALVDSTGVCSDSELDVSCEFK